MIVGIDLGTTNSEIAVVKDGKVFLISIDGSKIVPSVVSANATGQMLIGIPAVNNELAAPVDTIRCIKRKMGQEDTVTLQGQLYSPPMISGLILKRLKLAAEEFLNQTITQAVITVPAFFNEKQREATKEAAEFAGLEPVRLLNEPTAAALAYSLGLKESGNVLIYDLGGGTFDVSIVNLSEQLMEVKASHGDVELGGSDFDRMIVDKIRKEFFQQHSVDLAGSPLTLARLLRAAETAKIRLSTEAIAQLTEEFIAEKDGVALHLKMQITRTEFEEMIRPKIEQSLLSVRKALEMASLVAVDLKKVILVGGATLMPLVSQMLEEELRIVPQSWIDPSTVVAMGAAVEAANLSGESIGPRMVDITPHSLGITTVDQNDELKNFILIRRNTPIPCSASRVFYKCYEDQDKVQIEVHQGESQEIQNNRLLGKFFLEGLGSYSNRDIHVKFHLDRSGLLEVTATDIASGKQTSKTLRRISESRKKSANLAELESVRIFVEEKAKDAVEAIDLNAESEEIISVEQVQENLDLIHQAQLLLKDDKLDSVDREDLSQALISAQAGDADAMKKLSELMYYLI